MRSTALLIGCLCVIRSGNPATVPRELLTTETDEATTTELQPSPTFSSDATEIPPTSSEETTRVTKNPACHSAASNGLLEIGCWGYKECVDGQLLEHRCPDGEVLEKDTMTCVKQGTGHTDCGNPGECPPNYEDVLYPDLIDDCESFHRCVNGTSIGRHYCPASLVFNFELQLCDYKNNVAAPCGTRPAVG